MSLYTRERERGRQRDEARPSAVFTAITIVITESERRKEGKRGRASEAIFLPGETSVVHTIDALAKEFVAYECTSIAQKTTGGKW